MHEHPKDGSQGERAARGGGRERIPRRRGRGTGPNGNGIRPILDSLRQEMPWTERIVHWHEMPPRPGRTVDWPARLAPELVDVFRQRGATEPYEHQARAIELALDGHDVLVATPTASGKTIGYVAPVLQRLIETKGGSRALFLYPTKALSQDQTAGLTGLIEELHATGIGRDWNAFTYDGDTPPAVRRNLRDRGHLILTNPWMLHQGILPNHAKWAELFRDLEFVVVDEVHSLSGVFGSSVANVLRRLVRIARHYGANPRFLASSATLRDPAAHAAAVFGREVQVVDEDASPAGARHFAVYEPPLLDPVAGLRANALEEARTLARAVVGPGHQTIFFCARRTAVEVLTRYLKESARELGLQPSEVKGYRGGYLPNMRREIEAGLREGTVKVVVSTNALELGVDIGALDVAVLVGYPGSQASFWQRAGRVGRRGRDSLVLQIARSEPVDQYLAHHPEYLFQASRERLGVDPDNLVLLSEQLKCAAFELPFKRAEVAAGETPPESGLQDEPGFRTPDALEVLEYLADGCGFLLERESAFYWMADAYPAQDVNLAGGDIDNVLILEQGTETAIGEVDREGSLVTCHEGAIYIVQGVTWRIERFDHKNRRAYAKAVESDYFTDAQTDTEVRVLRLESCLRRPRPETDEEDHSVWRGEVHVTTVATIYKKIRFYTRENLGAGDIQLPPEELDTEAFVLTLSEPTAAELGLATADRGAAWRALGQVLRRVTPLFVRCQPSDLGLSSHVRSPHFGRPTLFLYDRVQGGVGLVDLLVDAHRDLLVAARDVVRRCACTQGCPACVGPVEEVGPEGKAVVLAILEHLLAGPAPVDHEAIELAGGGGAVGTDDLRAEGHLPRGVGLES